PLFQNRQVEPIQNQKYRPKSYTAFHPARLIYSYQPQEVSNLNETVIHSPLYFRHFPLLPVQLNRRMFHFLSYYMPQEARSYPRPTCNLTISSLSFTPFLS